MGLFDSIKRKFGFNITNKNGVNEEYRGKDLKKRFYKKGGVLHGLYQEFLGAGDDVWAKAEINYKNGAKDGLSRYFHKKHISAEGNFENGKVTGIIKKYFLYKEGLKQAEFIPVINESANLDEGVYNVFSKDGKMIEKSEIDAAMFEKGISSNGYWGSINPLKKGLSEKWFENGQLKESGYWENDKSRSKRIGEHKLFHENGNLFKHGDWENGQPQGIHKFYFPSENIEFEVEFKYGTPIKQTWYNEDGSLMNPNEIIEKAGIDSLRTSWKTKGGAVIRSTPSKARYAEGSNKVNGHLFEIKGEVNYYYHDNYRTAYDLGHTYSLVEENVIVNAGDNLIEKKILEKLSDFDEQLHAERFEIDKENFEIKYWYDVILNRVSTSNSMPDMGEELDYKLKSWIWGHADEYGKKYINKDFSLKRIIALTRIICFGHIYSVIFEISNEVKSISKVSESYIEKIEHILFHVKASVYGAIKFALFSGVSKDEVRSWFPMFEDNEELIMGVNSVEDTITKMLLGDGNSKNENIKKFEGVFDGENRVQIYDLSEDGKENIPDWFKGPFYVRGGNVTSKATGKSYFLNSLEKSVFAEYQYNSVMIDIINNSSEISEDGINTFTNIFNNPYFENLFQVVEEGPGWFKANNLEAYKLLFNN